MDIMELGAIGELVGGVAVIATLVFLALEVRLNTKAIRASASFQAGHSWAEVADYIAQNPRIAALARKANIERVELNEEEQEEYTYLARSAFHRLEAQFFLQRAGLMDGELWEVRKAYARRWLETPAGSVWWRREVRDGIRTAAFLNEIEPHDR